MPGTLCEVLIPLLNGLIIKGLEGNKMSRLPKSIIRFSSGSHPIEMLICGGKEPSDDPWTSRFIGD